MNIEEYLRSFLCFDSPGLEQMAASNRLRDDLQPSIEPELARFLCLLVRLMGAKSVLELGTSNGYSAIWLAAAVSQTGGHVWTVDNHERTNREAAENIRSAGVERHVTLLHGDVETVLQELVAQNKSYDLVFQDCGKSSYPGVLGETVALVREGGIILADDTLFSFQKNVRRNLGTYTDKYNKLVFAEKSLYSVILPVGHGITLSYKIPQKQG
ncbi:MAG: class I SAM-dependent methyltransferase [Spirochaetales bacterium]|nr:class I SAM-dependent methyltransferase [Spirochaetales bacterium]